MKKNKFKLLGIIAAVAVIGLSMIGCDNGNVGGGGSLPDALVNTMWSQDDGSGFIDFDGNDFMHASSSGGGFTGGFSISGNRIDTGFGAFNFVLSNDNTTMTISGATGNLASLNGTWTLVASW